MNQATLDDQMDNHIDRTGRRLIARFERMYRDAVGSIAAEGNATTFKQLQDRRALYNRMDDEFQAMIGEIEDEVVYQYQENYLRSGYLYEQTIGEKINYAIPTAASILAIGVAAYASIAALIDGYRTNLLLALQTSVAVTGITVEVLTERLENIFRISRNRVIKMMQYEAERAQNMAREAAAYRALEHMALEDIDGDEDARAEALADSMIGPNDDAATIEEKKELAREIVRRQVSAGEAGNLFDVPDSEAYDDFIRGVIKRTKSKKQWKDRRDERVRHAHRVLHNTFADEEGYFHYEGDRAKHPYGFSRYDLNVNCRCRVRWIMLGVNPEASDEGYYRWKAKRKEAA